MRTWADVLAECPTIVYSMAGCWMMDLLTEAEEIFGSTPRPEHFTNYRHCCECAEHDETLRSATPETLSYESVRPGWDPLCFVSPQGFQYYFPALVRLASDRRHMGTMTAAPSVCRSGSLQMK